MKRDTTRGYSLMELVVVLAILAVAALLVGPAVGRTVNDVRGRAEAAAVSAFLRGAREQAVVRRHTLEVILDSDAHTLLLRRPAREGQVDVPARRTFSALLRIEGGPASAGVAFLPHGMSSGGRVTVDAPGGRRHLITVDALTGRVTTQRVSP
jgi:general secretion pathway protein H